MSRSATIDKSVVSDTRAAFVKCQEDRTIFSKYYLGTPVKTSYQQKLYNNLFINRRVCVKSAHDMGKTFTFTDAVLEALLVDGTMEGGCYIIITAPTYNLIKNVFFAEIRKKINQSKVPLGLQVNMTEIKVDEKWMCIGYSPQIAAQGDLSNFQGFHAPLVIVIFEEATGVDRAIWDMAEGMTTSDKVYMWAIGNPTDSTSEFARCFQSPFWFKETWSCFMSPNLIANDITTIDQLRAEAATVASLPDEDKISRLNAYVVVQPQLLTLRWVVERYLEWGEDSPLFQGKALAQFPEMTEDTLFGIQRLEQCMSPGAEEEGLIQSIIGSKVESIGCDVARFGTDKAVIFGFCGNVESRKEIYSKKETTFLSGRMVEICRENVAKDIITILTIDEGAMGAGVVDQLRNNKFVGGNQKFVRIHAVNFGADAINLERYYNAAAEMYVLASMQCKSKAGFVLKQDEGLISELASRKYKFDSDGRFMLEKKEDFKKRIGHSPDIADAFVLAFYHNPVNTLFKAYGDFTKQMASLPKVHIGDKNNNAMDKFFKTNKQTSLRDIIRKY